MSDPIHAETRILGTLRVENGLGTIRMEDTFATDIDDLWAAVTDPNRLKRWIAEVDGDLRQGGEFHAIFTSGWEGISRITVCEPPRRLVVVGIPGNDEQNAIEAILTAEGHRTRLVVEERGLPIDEYAYHGSGWQAHFEDLAAHLGGRDASDWEARWKQLTPTYLRMLDEGAS